MKPEKGALVFFCILVALFLVTGLFYEIFNPLLEFDRREIDRGEWWRIFTGNIVHLNHWHLALNMSGLILFYYFFYDVMTLRAWLVSCLLGIVGTGLSLYYFNPGLNVYVGFSGVLHGIFLCGLVLSFHQTPKLNALIIFLVLCRLAWEQMPSYDVDYMYEYIGGSVFVDAHLYGSIFGFISSAVLLSWQHLPRREEESPA